MEKYNLNTNDFQIEIGRRNLFRGFFENNPNNSDNYIYYISFKDNLGTLIRELKCLGIDIEILMDNLCAILYYGDNINEIFIHFKSSDSNMIENIVKFEKGELLQEGFLFDYNKIYCTIYDYIDERMYKICKIDFTTVIEPFIQYLQEILIEK